MLSIYIKYNNIGDIIALVISLMLLMILNGAHAKKDNKFISIFNSVILNTSACVCHLLFGIALSNGLRVELLAVLHVLYYIFLINSKAIIVKYTINLFKVKRTKLYSIIINVISCAFAIVLIILAYVMYINNALVMKSNNTHLSVGYVFYIIIYDVLSILVGVIMLKNKDKIIKPFYIQLFRVFVVSFIIMIIQQCTLQSSYNTISIILCLVIITYFNYSNPYDLINGALHRYVLSNEILDKSNAKKAFDILYMKLFINDNNISAKDRINEILLKYPFNIVNGCTLYKLSEDEIILMIENNQLACAGEIVNYIRNELENISIDNDIKYKIIHIEDTKDICTYKHYIDIIKFLLDDIEDNGFLRVDNNKVKQFNRYMYIYNELKDIADKKDLNDSRVEIYCQPILNTETNKFDSAESLMRLNTEKFGMLYPDEFIPIAEKNSLIHILSKIILNKVCLEIKNILQKGFKLKRISVNFSVVELREDNFCHDIFDIIESHDISYSNVGIELTETATDLDFGYMKQIVTELKDKGLTLYLDDFGSGYSNFDRIMQLPLDIIKFDRSLLLQSNKSDDSTYMVENFSNMFKKLNYIILYEGVEDDNDEIKCKSMNASYLQGYKYSKPIKISELYKFLEKEEIL